MDDTSSQSPNTDSRPLVAYVVADGRLLATRCLPLVRAAIGRGFATAVITSADTHRAEIEAAGARLVSLPMGSGLNPMKAGYAAGQLSAVLKVFKADIVHCIGIGSIVTGGTAAAMAGIGKRVYEPTHLSGGDSLATRLTRKGLAMTIRGPLANSSTRYLFETDEDARALGFDAADIAVTILGETDAPRVCDLYAELAAQEG